MEKKTNLFSLQINHLNTDFLEYLRTALITNYKEEVGTDKEYIMISCPRLIAYELMVIDWAIKILVKHGEVQLFKKSTLEQDRQELEQLSQK